MANWSKNGVKSWKVTDKGSRYFHTDEKLEKRAGQSTNISCGSTIAIGGLLFNNLAFSTAVSKQRPMTMSPSWGIVAGVKACARNKMKMRNDNVVITKCMMQCSMSAAWLSWFTDRRADWLPTSDTSAGTENSGSINQWRIQLQYNDFLIWLCWFCVVGLQPWKRWLKWVLFNNELWEQVQNDWFSSPIVSEKVVDRTTPCSRDCRC